MLKVYKGWGPMYGMGEPVQISNEVHMPVAQTDNDDAGDAHTPEERRLIKELRKKEEELRTMEAEHKYELERRINEESESKLKQFLARRSDSLEKERKEILDAAKREANAITADAKTTTMSVIKKAESESLKLREEARREGHDEGYAEGREESLEKYKKYIDAAGKLLGEINSRKEAYYISNEEEMRETVFELVQKVIGAELKADPAIIDGIIGEAAKTFRNSDYIKITLADDAISERYVTDRKLMRDIIPYIPEIEIEFDDEAEEGTVIIDNGSEIVDAGIPTQLDFLKEILRNTRGEATEDEEEFMEEIKGRAQRRKNITITAADDYPAVETARAETAEEIQPVFEEPVPVAEPEPIAAEPIAEPEPTIESEPVVEEVAEPTVKESKPAAKPKTSRSRKKAASKPEPVIEPEPIVEAEPVIEADSAALAEAMAFMESAAESLAEPETAAVIDAAMEAEIAADMDPTLMEAMAYVELAAEELPEREAAFEMEEPIEPEIEPGSFSEAMLNAAADLAEAAEALGAAEGAVEALGAAGGTAKAEGTAETPAAEEVTLEQLTME